MSENQPAIEDVINMELWQNIENEPTEDLMAMFVGARRNMGLSLTDSLQNQTWLKN